MDRDGNRAAHYRAEFQRFQHTVWVVADAIVSQNPVDNVAGASSIVNVTGGYAFSGLTKPRLSPQREESTAERGQATFKDGHGEWRNFHPAASGHLPLVAFGGEGWVL